MASNDKKLKFSCASILLFDPPFWGLEEFNDFYNPELLPGEKYWPRALDIFAEAGVDGFEIQFGPSHWRNALAFYGSGTEFKKAANAKNLEISSGFSAELVIHGGWKPGDSQQKYLEYYDEYAAFLKEAGCGIMIAGLPMRTSWDADPPQFIDMKYAEELADLLNQIGYTAVKHGIKFAIHPEAHAVLWQKRDIDLFLMLTDPMYVGFCPDTCHITLGRGNPLEIIREHKERFLIAHWKDAREPVPYYMTIDENIWKSHHPYMARPGQGIVDWQGMARLMREIKYEGWAVLELDAGANPPLQLSEAREAMERTVLHAYSSDPIVRME